MADIPAPLTYATIICEFITIEADSNDGGNAPDISQPSGIVTFTPNARVFKTTTGTGVIALLEDVVARVDNGVLYAPDNATVLRLLATDSPGIEPTDFQWTAVFELEDVRQQPATVTFEAPGGSTVNLADDISVDPTPPALTSYVTSAALATALADYVTSTSLTTTLTGYVTTAALTTALSSYALSSSVTTLSGTVTTLSASVTTIQTAVDLLITRTGGNQVVVWNGAAFKSWDGDSFDGTVRTSAAEMRIFCSTSEVVATAPTGYATRDIWFAHEDQP